MKERTSREIDGKPLLLSVSRDHQGITFIRLSRPATPIVYKNAEDFQIGKAKILQHSDKDQCLVRTFVVIVSRE